MYADKLIRSGDTGIEGSILRAAKRALQAGDEPAFKGILAQVSELSALARKDKDKALQLNVSSLINQLDRIVKTRGAAVVMETKTVVTAFKRTALADEDLEEIASADPIGSIEGYGAVFGNVDLGGDVIKAGAFRRSLAEWERSGRLPVMLAQHDNRIFPVGAWNFMREDSIGLRVKGLVANTTRGREAWTLIHMKPSALDGLSIGYSVAKSDFRADGARELADLDLFEISMVSLPMNTRARLEIGKSAGDDLSTALTQLKRAARKTEADNVIQFPKASNEYDGLADKLNELALQITAHNVLMRIKR